MLQSSRAAEGSSWTTAVELRGLRCIARVERCHALATVASIRHGKLHLQALAIETERLTHEEHARVQLRDLRESVQERILANISTFEEGEATCEGGSSLPPSLDLHSTSAIRIFCLVAYGIGVIIVRILHTTYHPPKRERFRLCRTRFTRSESLGLAIASRKAGLPPTQSVAHGVIPMMLKCARGAA